MTDAQITYEQLFDALRREKNRDELQKLDEGFYHLARVFIADKHNAILSENSGGYGGLGAQRAGIEYQNAKRIIRELYDRRERKIVTLAMHRARTDAIVVDMASLLPEERVLFDALLELLVQMREKVFSAVGVTGGVSFSSSSSTEYVERNNAASSSASSQHSSQSSAPSSSSLSSLSSSSSSSFPSSSSPRYDGDGSLPPSYEEPSSSPIGQNVERNFSVEDDGGSDGTGDVDRSGGGTSPAQELMFRVKFLRALPKLAIGNGVLVGPYATGAVAELPDDIARVLIKKGYVEGLDS